jgi:putative oxidoreductase
VYREPLNSPPASMRSRPVERRFPLSASPMNPDSTASRVLSLTRIVFGLMFAQHGAQKLFGVLGREEAVEPFTQLWFAGVLELFGGALVVLGLFTRPVAFVLSGLMAWAYFQAHATRAFFPVENGGELAILFCWFFFYLVFAAGGRWSVDAVLARRREGRRSVGASAGV